MKKIVAALAIAVALGAARPAATVYVCDSSGSVAYHSDKNCSGLNRCTHKIIAVTETEAIKTYGKRKCRKCY